MKPTVKLDETLTPEGDPLELLSHDGSFTIQSGREVLMCTSAHSSEEDLGRFGVERFAACRKPRILIGGLGLGYTLKAALDTLGKQDAEITVAEITPAIIEWHRTHMKDLHGSDSILADPRVRIVPSPVQDLIWQWDEPYHSILLDVDNGPSAFTGENNDLLYGHAGIAAAYEALNPLGLLAVWSAEGDKRFGRALEETGFRVDTRVVKGIAKAKRGPLHTIWLCQKPATDKGPKRPGRSGGGRGKNKRGGSRKKRR